MNPGSIFYLLVIAGLIIWVIRLRRREQAFIEALETRVRERKTVFVFLNRLGERLTTSKLAMEPALEIIVETIAEVTDAESGAVFVLDPAEKALSAKAVHGMFPPLSATTGYVLTKQKYLSERVKREKIAVGEGVIGEVAATDSAVLINDAQSDPRVPKTALDYLSIRSIMAAPLRARGRVVGVIAVVNKKGAPEFTQADLDLLLPLADQAASTVELVKLYDELAEKQRIEQELRLAHDFQKMLLPRECPQVPGFQIAAFSAPALEVGGDYYDFFWVDDARRHLGVVIADVSGKGIPGALIMSMARSTIRAEARGNLSPRDVLLKANERAYADTREIVFITMTYGFLDTRERRFRFARAGHEPLVTFKRDSENAKLTSPEGIAMGMVGSDMFQLVQEAVVPLDRGDIAVLYTDGVVEAMDSQSEEYGQKRFFDFLAANRARPPQEIIEKTIEDITDFTRGHPQHDDITLVAIRVLDESEESREPADAGAQAGA
jgi:sigma-B regulation protein RsbU (phosphoserine phosphatase)